MNISEDGLDIIRDSEGLSYTAYTCPAGKLTIGYGHTGKDVTPDMVIDIFEANALLRKDVAWAEAAVERLVEVPLTQGQFDALVSFTFNVGSGAFGKSSMRRVLNGGDYEAAANWFPRWVHSGGKVLPGLVTRRERERNRFMEA